MYLLVRSVILTEDTDSFIIGERVWVSGKKSGHIAYIGETQFAPGEWAGIALDEPIGKNDGSVGGIRYFQCEPKKGVFCRLTRLTRQPMNQEDMSSRESYIPSPVSPVGSGMRGSPVSPANSTSLSRMSVSMRDSNTSLASNASHHIDYKVGDRVIIKSSQGSKVCKSPLKTRPGNCQIHSSSGALPPSGILRRTGSRESMSNASITSSSGLSQQGRRVRLGIAALTPHHDTAKDLLKEKQQHIEQLLKERELERSEIAKCASQVEDAEQKFYRTDTETKLQECMDIMKELKQNKCDLQNQLEDEKRKNEDLLFRLEEISITKDETDVLNRNNLTKINELEEKLGRANEVPNLTEEVSNLKKQLSDSNAAVMERDHATKILIESLQRDVDKYKADLLERNNTIVVLEQELSKTTAELKAMETKISTEKTEAETALERQIEQLRIELSAKTYDLETAGNSAQMKDSEIVQLKSEIDNLNGIKMQLEQATAALSSREESLVSIQSELKSSKENFDKTLNELKSNQDTLSTDVSKLKTENDELLSNLKLQSNNVGKEQELEKARNDIKNIVEEKDKALRDVGEKYEVELENITTKLKQLQVELDEKNLTLTEMQELTNNTSKEITEKNGMIEQLGSTVSRLEQQNEQMTNEKADFAKSMKESSDKINELTNQLEDSKQQLHTLTQKLEAAMREGDECKNALKEKAKEVDDLKFELQSVKETLEAANNDLAQYQANFSDVEVTLRKEKEELRASLHSEKVEFEKCRKDFQQKMEEAEKMILEKTVEITEKNQKLENLEKKLREIEEHSEKGLDEFKAKYEKDMEDLQTKISNLLAELESKNIKMEEAEKMILEKTVEITDKNQKLENSETKLREIEERNDKILNEIKEKYQKDMEDSQTKILNLLAELEKTNIKMEEAEKLILEKTVEISDKNQKLENSEKTLREIEENGAKGLNEFKEKYQKEIEDSKTRISNLLAELESKNIKIEDGEKMISEKTVEVTDKIQQLENLEKKLREIEEHSEKRLNEFKEKYQKDMEDAQAKISNLIAELESKNSKIADIEIRIEKARSKAKEKIEEFEMLKTKWENTMQSAADSGQNSELNEKLTVFKCLNEEVKKQIEETLIHYVGLDLEKGDLADSLRLKIEGLLTATKNIELLCKEVSENSNNVAKITEELESTKQKLVTAENEFKLNRSSLNDVEQIKKEKEVIIANLERQNTELQSLNKEISSKLSNKQLDEQSAFVDNVKADYGQKLAALEKTIQELSQMNKELEKQKTDIEMKLKSSMDSETQLKQIISSSTADRTIEELRKELKDANQKLSEKGKQVNEEIGSVKLEVQKNQEQVRNGAVQGDMNGEPNMQAQINDMKPYNQLFEEKIFAESQVKFLNSIIVDMQDKNEKQKARIEILEKGYIFGHCTEECNEEPQEF
nr:unnamed protein product [Callosobruchus chinensis]